MSPLPTSVTIPFVFGKPVNIWLGMVLAVLGRAAGAARHACTQAALRACIGSTGS